MFLPRYQAGSVAISPRPELNFGLWHEAVIKRITIVTNKRKLTINKSVLYNSEICKNNARLEAVDGKKNHVFLF